MKKQIKKWLFVLYLAMMFFLLVVMPTIYLTGMWLVQLGSVKLSFTGSMHIGSLALLFAIDIHKRLDRWLSPPEAYMSFSKRKARRWRIRLVALAILFLITGVAYLVGQKYQLHAPFEYLGNLGVGDLFFFWLIYIFATFVSVIMPQTKEDNDNKAKDIFE